MAAPRGLGFLARYPRLLPLVVIPVLINAVLLGLLFYFSLHYYNRWLDAVLPQSDAWYWAVVSWILPILMILLLALLVVFLFTPLAMIVASPFYDALSARTEQIVTGREEAPFSLAALLKEMARTVVEEIKKIILLAAAMLAVLILSLIPVIGWLAGPVLSFVVAAMWWGLSVLDYPMARHGYRLGQKLALIKSHKTATFGFGLWVLVCLAVPLLQLVVIPVSVAGATLLFLEWTGEKSA